MHRLVRVIAVAALLPGCGSSDAPRRTPAPAPTRSPAGSQFVPAAFGGRVDNPWFPLPPGRTLRYRGQDEGTPGREVFTVTHRTKTILGVAATVVHDRIIQHGRVTEDTLDYYAQDAAGTVWYLGEDTAELDRRGAVVSREGTWRAGVHGARPGIFMPAHPRVGQTFQQEHYPGHAEDHFRVAGLDATVRVPAVSTHHALRTAEWTPLEPGVRDAKFYVRGLGTVLEETVAGGNERWSLVSARG
jgi:hypothetical protein